jgi:thiol-disulfide isomerase/thioredoxin
MRDDTGRTRLHGRILLAFAAILILALVSARPGRTQTDAGKATPHAGKAAGTTDPPLIDLAGYRQVLAKYKGKPLVVNFWATWCEPCRDEYPMIVELAKQFKPQGVSVIGVDMDDESDMNLVRRFITRTQPQFPNYRQKPGIDLDAFYEGVNPEWKGTMPQTIFYGRDGQILGFFLGTRPQPVFEQAFRATLGPAGGGGDTGHGGAQ